MLLARHRVTQLIDLSSVERAAQGPERQIREQDVAHLIKAAYDDATQGARAEFMARIKTMPTTAWPWSAMQAMTPQIGGGGLGKSLASITAVQKTPLSPPALILIRGQAESADIDPGDRLPDRGTPEAVPWEPLYRALDLWDITTIMKSIGAQGWMTAGITAGQVPKDTGNDATEPPKTGSKDLPAPKELPQAARPWTHPAVLAGGAAVVVAMGIVIYNVGQSRSRRRLEDALGTERRS